MSIITPIASGCSKVIGPLTKTRPVKGLCNYFNKDFEKALAYSTVGSIVAKDGIGCGMYVYQSMHNKDIPEKRRNFVAALDLTNGVLMILAQIGMFFAMRKLNDKLFHKIFNKSFDKAGHAFKTLAEQVRIVQKKAGIKPDIKDNIKIPYDKVKNTTFGIFKFVTELAAATILGKRVIVPLIATPLAQKVEKKMNEKHSAEGATSEPAKAETPADKEEVKTVDQPATVAATEKPADDGNTNLLAKYKK